MKSLEVLQYLPWACEYLFPYYTRPGALNYTLRLLVFSTLRAYVLSSRTRGQWSISTLVLLCSLAPLIINFVGTMLTMIFTVQYHDTYPGWHGFLVNHGDF